MSFTAKDVQALRQATGAGMMDAKTALEETDGDIEAAAKWLREKGLAKAADRADRENTQGVGRRRRRPASAAIVELKCETDFSAKAADFVAAAQELADPVAARRLASTTTRTASTTSRSRSRRTSRSAGSCASRPPTATSLDSYLHLQDGRGVNAVLVELDGGDHGAGPRHRRAHRLHQAAVPHPRRGAAGRRRRGARPRSSITKAEGKPEQAVAKIVEGRLNAWYKDQVLLEQPYAKDDKQSITQLLGDATLARFAQVYIGS